MKAPERIFYHYEELEEYHAGMWRIVRGEQRKRNIEAASDLMRCPDEFKEAMMSAIKAWPKSCEANLTADGLNKIAWLGHAGCCLSVGSAEENTRAAWHTLGPTEQDDANRVAAEVLAFWQSNYKPKRRQLELFEVANDA
jgi:hypothetical protein